MTKQDVLTNPINFLYAFSNANFEKQVARYISKRAANTIESKRLNQVAYLQVVYGGTSKLSTAYTEVANAIQSQYGYTPQAILSKLLAGETVAGKNWKAGVYGVGETNPTTYADNSGITVNTSTGKLYKNGAELQATVAPMYATDKKGKTYISGYYYAVDEKTAYTTSRDKNGNFYAATYGNTEAMYNANGSKITAADCSSVWENIATAMPFIERLLQWIASIVNNFVPLSTKNTVPSQKEFITDNTGDISISSVGILGAALVGGYLLMGGTSTKKK